MNGTPDLTGTTRDTGDTEDDANLLITDYSQEKGDSLLGWDDELDREMTSCVGQEYNHKKNVQGSRSRDEIIALLQPARDMPPYTWNNYNSDPPVNPEKEEQIRYDMAQKNGLDHSLISRNEIESLDHHHKKFLQNVKCVFDCL